MTFTFRTTDVQEAAGGETTAPASTVFDGGGFARSHAFGVGASKTHVGQSGAGFMPRAPTSSFLSVVKTNRKEQP